MKIAIQDKSGWNQLLCCFRNYDEEIAFAEKQGYSLIPPGDFEFTDESKVFYVDSDQLIAQMRTNSAYSGCWKPTYPLFTKNMNLQNKYIHVPNHKISTIVQTQLFELGYKWANGETRVIHYNGDYLGFNKDGGIIRILHKKHEEVSIQELFTTFPTFTTFTPPRPDVIFPPGEIVRDYSVVIGEKGITVGCQTVSFQAFEKLAGAVENYLANK